MKLICDIIAICKWSIPEPMDSGSDIGDGKFSEISYEAKHALYFSNSVIKKNGCMIRIILDANFFVEY